jgi:site-specific DNA-methyltransferase (adenine-specific)
MDCIEGMKLIPDKSINLILCDLPYGTTACSWDTIIPFEPLWEQYERIIKDNGNIVLTSSQPFTTKLINSNFNLFRYSLVWNKKKAGNIFLAKIQPMKIHEDISIFYKDLDNEPTSFMDLRNYFKEMQEFIGLNIKQINSRLKHRKAEHCFYWKNTQFSLPTESTYEELIQVFNLKIWNKLRDFKDLKNEYNDQKVVYNPQKIKRDKIKRSKNYGTGEAIGGNGEKENKVYEYEYKNPVSILEFSNASQKNKIHPTQKPIDLFEYLIKTYSNENDIILDNCIGSGTTAVAAEISNRKWIGFEIESKYIELANKRLEQIELHNDLNKL